MGRRPRSSIQSVIVHSNQDEAGNWIPLVLGINSWVNLKPPQHGGHGRDSSKHGGDTFEGGWKAQIVRFNLLGERLDTITVRHAYIFRQLNVHPDTKVIGACNYLYPSTWEDDIDPKSILDVLVVFACGHR